MVLPAPWRLVPAVAATVSLIAAGLGGCASAPRPTGLAWAACATPAPGLQCSGVDIPLDGAQPGGPTIRVAIDRYRATGRRIGSLLVNPGGPGVSGVDSLPGFADRLSPALRQHFDIVGFDPPGVGHSQPVTCLDGHQLDAVLHVDPAPPDAAGFAALVAAARELAGGCEARSGAVLGHVSTVDAARAMDGIRQALGDAQITYVGFSYGTLLGATYAERYPGRVRAMVLDGALNPALDPVTAGQSQAAALEAQFYAFQRSCAADAHCAWRPARGDLETDYTALRERLRRQPIAAAGTIRRAGPGELFYATAAGLYEPAQWAQLATALAAADRGDGGPLLQLFDSYVGRRADGTYQPVVESETAVNCLDAPVPPIRAQWSDEAAAAATAPDFGVGVLLGDLTCAVWPVRPTGSPHPIHAPGSPPILVVSSTGDPITPYQWGEEVAAQLAQGMLLTRVGEGHTGYAASSCVRRWVDAYLVSLVRAPAGAHCPSDG